MSLNANYLSANDWHNQLNMADPTSNHILNNQQPTKSASDQLMSQLVAEQVRRTDDKSNNNWMKNNINNPVALTIGSFVFSVIFLILLEPSFVRKKKMNNHENGGEYELERTRVSFVKVMLVSILVSLLVYGVPVAYVQYKKNQSS